MTTQTTESITAGHPDKVADQISDALLDAHLKQHPQAKVAIETMITGDTIFLAGETGGPQPLNKQDRAQTAKTALKEAGYNYPTTIIDRIVPQSPQIAHAVTTNNGAGDQGIMYGHATNETPELMPLTHMVARDLTDMLTHLQQTKYNDWLQPDGKTQVTMTNGQIDHIVLSAHHNTNINIHQLRKQLTPHIHETLATRNLHAHPNQIDINPAGTWTHGGPAADTGVTGRKLMVDTYGGLAPHGGGAFSGKDPTKVDRSAAYAARQAAKWLVEQGHTNTATVALAYAIGKPHPTMINAGTPHLTKLITNQYDFRPTAIIQRLNLTQPIYQQTAKESHFGKPWQPWEHTS